MSYIKKCKSKCKPKCKPTENRINTSFFIYNIYNVLHSYINIYIIHMENFFKEKNES